MKGNRSNPVPEKPWCLGLAVLLLVGGVVIIASSFRASHNPLFCSSIATFRAGTGADDPTTAQLYLNTILHYATSRTVPQQSLAEITVSFDVLRSLSPCNFLVFGLGHDSLMWTSFNPLGTTLFLEEDPKWVQTVLKDSPTLQAHTVQYRTKLSAAVGLLSSYRSVPECWPSRSFLRGNIRCKLALTGLPDEVYDKEWDLIMIDAPRGYFPDAPGRMGAIYSAAVMARNRKGPGVTHVFLHDIDRRVEKAYAAEFLCRKHLVKAVGRLWHFEIPPATNMSSGSGANGFC